MIPQILILLLHFVSLLLSAHKHGKEKTTKTNFWVSLIASAIGLTILYFGGFFDNILK